jgi:ribonuclease HI
MADQMQRALNKVSMWGREHGLEFNPKKTVAVMFERSRRYKCEPDIKMDGEALVYSKHMKYLGVTFSKRLTWTAHIKEKVRLCGYLLKKTTTVIGREWGLSPDKLMWIYTAIIRPRLTYGAVVWAHDLTEDNLKKLRGVQRRALSTVTNCRRSTPGRGLDIICGIPPIDLFLEETAICTRLRIKDLTGVDGWSGMGSKAGVPKRMGHRAIWDHHLEQIPESIFPCDDIPPVINWLRNMEVIEPDINIFTDGSKMEDDAGYGWAITSKNHVIDEGSEYLGNDEVYTAELSAIHDVCWWILNNQEYMEEKGLEKALIQTDSLSSLQAIFAPYIKSQLVLDCKNLIQRCNQRSELGIKWVKGHSGVVGNEFADYLAKNGAEKGGLMPEPPGPISKTKVRKAIRAYTDTRWQTRWDEIDPLTHRVSRALLPKINRKLNKILPKMSKSRIRYLVGFATGHDLYAAWLFNIEKYSDIDITCKICEEPESVEDPVHLWSECSRIHRDPERHEPTLDNFTNLIINYQIKDLIIDVNKTWLESRVESDSS